MALKIDQCLAHLGDGRDHRGGFAHQLGLEGRISELFGIEFQRGGDRKRLVGQVGPASSSALATAR